MISPEVSFEAALRHFAQPLLMCINAHQPHIDFSRFQVTYSQKFEPMLRYARDRGLIVSVVQEHRRTKPAR